MEMMANKKQIWAVFLFKFKMSGKAVETTCNINTTFDQELGNGNPLQYSCLENPMDRGAWQATVHGVAKSRTQLSDFTSLSLMNV